MKIKKYLNKKKKKTNKRKKKEKKKEEESIAILKILSSIKNKWNYYNNLAEENISQEFRMKKYRTNKEII